RHLGRGVTPAKHEPLRSAWRRIPRLPERTERTVVGIPRAHERAESGAHDRGECFPARLIRRAEPLSKDPREVAVDKYGVQGMHGAEERLPRLRLLRPGGVVRKRFWLVGPQPI